MPFCVGENVENVENGENGKNGENGENDENDENDDDVQARKRKRIRVSVVSMCSTKMELSVDGCTVAQVNALRRACLADVPVLAIDETQVHANTTGVHDETIGHRLGFVPLRHATNPLLEGMRRKGACTCRGACPMCEVPLAVHFEAADETSGRQAYRQDATGSRIGRGGARAMATMCLHTAAVTQRSSP